MANQVITRISPWPVSRILFLSGTSVFGLGGVFLGILEKDVLGIMGGAFLGLMGGLGIALGGAIFCAVFNLFAPLIGGIPVELSPAPEPAQEEQNEKNQPPVST